MPTAKPIMVMMFSTKKDSSKTWPTRAAAPVATTMDTTAITNGTKAAARAPSTTTRMIKAMGTPNISPFSRSS